MLDYPLWLPWKKAIEAEETSLNPCCAGLSSLTKAKITPSAFLKSLNPCCAGLSSLTNRGAGRWYEPARVLILVVLDYPLWLLKLRLMEEKKPGLNPCCAGLSSLTHGLAETYKAKETVLILVVLDYPLWQGRGRPPHYHPSSLNPCCAGLSSLTHWWRRCLVDLHSLNPCCAGLSSLTPWEEDENLQRGWS